MGIDYGYDPEDDLAIIEEAKQAKQNKAKRADLYEIRGPNGEPLPKEIQEALADRVDTSIEDARKNTPKIFIAMSMMIDKMAEMQYFMRSGSALISIIEVLDRMTEGYCSNVIAYNDSRRRIIYTKLLSNNLKGIMNVVDPGETNGYMNELWLFMDVFLDFLLFEMESSIDEYKYWCEVLEKDIDISLVEEGIIAVRTAHETVLFGGPPAYAEEP